MRKGHPARSMRIVAEPYRPGPGSVRSRGGALARGERLVGTVLGAEQFAAEPAWRDAGRLALVGMGVEPGLSDVFARYAADHLFSEIDEIGVRDGANLVVTGDDGEPIFAPSFSIWTTIEECLNPPVVYERVKGWFTTAPFSEPEIFDFPAGIGPVECVNVEHEEVLLIPRWVDAKRVTFKYGLGDEFIGVLKTLHKLGLDSTTPVRVRRPDGLASLLLLLAGIAAGISLLLRWLPGSELTGWDLVRRGLMAPDELHPLVRWMFQGGLHEDQRRAFLFTNVVDGHGRKYDIPVAVGALPDGVDVALEPLDLPLQVADLGLGAHHGGGQLPLLARQVKGTPSRRRAACAAGPAGCRRSPRGPAR